MAIDWTSIEGYRDDMTADEKLALLDNVELPKAADPAPAPKEDEKPTVRKTVPKADFDKVASELAAMKKQLRSRMTQEEAAEEERRSQQEAMEKELNELRREKTLSTYKASYLAQGYDDAMATQAATAMADGDMESVFAIMAKQRGIYEKSLRAQILKDTPVPPGGVNPDETEKQKAEEAKLRGYWGLN